MANLDVQRRIEAAQAAFGPFAAIAERDAASWEAVSGPLGGVCTSVKDILDVAGFATRRGSLLGADAPPAAADIEAVRRLRAAGARIVAKSTTTEFAHSPLGYAPLEGMTRNPWNPRRTCGGSSSGAGVAVATGATPLALATDAGCSTRLPAALTGVFGLKPTIGRIPHEGLPECFANIVHLGLLTADATLLGAALYAAAGPHPADSQSLGLPVLPAQPEPIGGGTALLWMKTGNQAIHPEIEAITREAVARLGALGIAAREAEFGHANPNPAFEALQQAGWAARFAAAAPKQRALLSRSFNAGIDAGAALGGADIVRALAARTAAFRAVQAVFASGYDVIVTPCASAPALEADHPLDAPLEIAGKVIGSLRSEWIPYLSLFDLSGHPAISIPAGLDGNGVPVGLQIAAPWGREDRLLGLARAWQEAWPLPAPCQDWLGEAGKSEDLPISAAPA